MNIVYTFDDGYTSITAVSLLSLLKSNLDEELKIFVVDCGISPTNKEIINRIAGEYHRSVTYKPAINLNERIPVALETGYWSVVCYARLFFAEMFPELDKIMHIDCDTVVRGSLAEVYGLELGENVCAACYDCVAASKRKLGMPKNRPYLSNGFVVFDLEKIRLLSLEEQFISYIEEHQGHLPHLDQDVLSDVVGEKTLILPPKYNLMSITAAYGSKSKAFFDKDEPYYTETELKEAVDNPIIVHYVGNRFMNRPWQQPCFHPYFTAWLENYHEMIEIVPDASMDLNSNYSSLRKLAGHLWNIGHKFLPIRAIELSLDVRYYQKKGR